LLVIARLVPNEVRELDEAISGRDPSSKSLRPRRRGKVRRFTSSLALPLKGEGT
jgi:hypothetical protein